MDYILVETYNLYCIPNNYDLLHFQDLNTFYNIHNMVYIAGLFHHNKN